MDLKVFFDKNHGYTATLESLGIVTEWNTFDELIYNVNEALELARQPNWKLVDVSSTFFKFIFSSKEHVAYS